MALASARYEYRITLAHVDRAAEVSATVIVARHPSETAEHLTLRVLSWCLLYEEGIEFGPGLSSPDAPDLCTRDLTGRLVTWIECGAARWDGVRKAIQHNSGIAVHAVFVQPRKRDELMAEIAEAGRSKEAASLTLWTLDPTLVASLARREERRQKWIVTVVGDHLYVEADGTSLDGEALRASG